MVLVAEPAADPMAAAWSSRWFEHTAAPTATVEGTNHLVRDINPAFCRLVGRGRDELVGQPFCELLPHSGECLASLDHVYHSGAFANLAGLERSDPAPVFSSYVMWPVRDGDRIAGVVIQVAETAPLHQQTRAMNEALLLGSIRQHELAAAAATANLLLKAEIIQRTQAEQDALLLTQEISHRIKNNLQTFVALIAGEIKRTPAEFAKGFTAMETRIAAIASLYDLISSNAGQTVRVDAYLRKIADGLAASLLEPSSAVTIKVEAEAVEIDSHRAASFGLMINELGTNAIKHAFPGGAGRLVFGARQVDGQLEFTVSDNGIGITPKVAASDRGSHGSDYVAIFVRQLGGLITVSPAAGGGTVVTVTAPLFLAART